MQVQQLL